ncbi:MAG: nucleotide exchange factor GrpE [Patescibacteria group bacterium]
MKDTHKKQEPEVPMIEKEKYLRLAADMDNLRKMQGHAAAEMAKWSAQAVITDMLELSDLLDTALAHAPPGATGGAWYEGLKQISKQFLGKMKRYGVSRIETAGKIFNPNTMEAAQMVGGGGSHQVKEEVRAGYLMHERVIRPARVIIYE